MADALSKNKKTTKKKVKLSCLLGFRSNLNVIFVSIMSSYTVLYHWCGCLSCCCKITGRKIKMPKKSFHPPSRLINRPHYTENLSWNFSYSVKLPLHQCSQWDDVQFFWWKSYFAEQHYCLHCACITFVIFAYLRHWVLALLKSTFIAGKRNRDFSVVLYMHTILIQNQQTNVSLCFFCVWHQGKDTVEHKTKSFLLLEREHTRNL